MDYEKIWSDVVTWLTTEGLKIAFAIVLIFISFQLINIFSRSIRKWTEKKKLDQTISGMLCYCFKFGLKMLVIIGLLGYLGIDTAAAASAVTTLGLGIGLAVQGSLANFAGGVLIIILRPIRVDDYIEAQGVSGTVEEITLFYTYIRSFDNKVICIPNGALANGNIINYSKKEIRRVDITFSVNVNEDFRRAEKIILDICAENKQILPEPQTTCRISSTDELSINLVLKAWCKTADYWDIYYNVIEDVKAKFAEENIKLPYKQMDVHLDK